jgi:hypothetical protein
MSDRTKEKSTVPQIAIIKKMLNIFFDDGLQLCYKKETRKVAGL